MICPENKVPVYLHWNNRPKRHPQDYLYYHKLYRIKPKGNPIEIPEAWVNAISCRWSKLIRKADILTNTDKGDDYNFVYISQLRQYQLTDTLTLDHEYKGTHVLTCVVVHSPEPCDYSHSEILIRHRIFHSDDSLPFFDETYTYNDWQTERALLKKSKARFFKELKKIFRADMIRIISSPSSKNTCFETLKARLVKPKFTN